MRSPQSADNYLTHPPIWGDETVIDGEIYVYTRYGWWPVSGTTSPDSSKGTNA